MRRTPAHLIFALLLSAAGIPGAGIANAQEADHPSDKPLIVASDFGVAPWMVRGANGPEGFGADLINEIGKELGRPKVEIVDINFSGLFAALFAKRAEFLVNPLNLTAERADKMLYTEPLFSTGNGFLVRAGEEMKGLEDLKGKSVAVNRGTSPAVPSPRSTKFRPPCTRQARTRRSRSASRTLPAATSLTPSDSKTPNIATRSKR